VSEIGLSRCCLAPVSEALVPQGFGLPPLVEFSFPTVCESVQGVPSMILESPVQKNSRIHGSNRSSTVIFRTCPSGVR
jgi:hypothetical protein